MAFYRRIFVCNICSISISHTVSDGSAKTLVLNKGHSRIYCPKEFKGDEFLLNSFCVMWVQKVKTQNFRKSV